MKLNGGICFAGMGCRSHLRRAWRIDRFAEEFTIASADDDITIVQGTHKGSLNMDVITNDNGAKHNYRSLK